MRKGFTLVELSIVLVIIGLLIGGILVAQSMISTSKIEMSIRQIGQFDAAVANFKTKYNQVPGDSNLFSDPGNNNGSTNGEPTEEAFAWEHLSQGVSLMTPQGKAYTGYDIYDGTIIPSAANCPTLAVNQNPAGYNCLTIEYPNYMNGVGRYRFQNGTVSAQPADANLTLLPGDALAIDLKIDDGNALSGVMNDYEFGSALTTDCNDGGGNYNTANTTVYSCVPFIQIGTQNGMNH